MIHDAPDGQSLVSIASMNMFLFSLSEREEERRTARFNFF